MTAEKIIERINKDSEKEIQAILEEAERQASGIIKDAKKEAEHEYEKMIADGNRHGENIKKILVSKASMKYPMSKPPPSCNGIQQKRSVSISLKSLRL